MNTQTELTDAEIARALRAAREYQNLTLTDMGQRLGQAGGKAISPQAYARFERGNALKAKDLELALRALGISKAQLADYLPADDANPFESKAASPRGLAVPVYGTPRFARGDNILQRQTEGNVIDASAFFGGSLRALQAPDSLMSPAVEQGQHVFFDLNSVPKRDDLCVIELTDGSLLIRNYKKQDGSSVFIETVAPEPAITALPLKSVTGLYAVKLRSN